jgi:hypothetical protein
MDLTDEHLTMLWEMSEIHFLCFQKFYKEYDIEFENVLEINHQKMMDIADGCPDCTEDMLTIIFESMIKDYKKMLQRKDPRDEEDY